MDQLTVGDTLLLTFADLGDRLTGVLVGKKDGQGLVVYADLPGKTRKRIRTNDAVLVQFASRSTLMGFRTRVSNTDRNGGSIFFLPWPEEDVKDMDARSEPRIACLFPGRIRIGETSLPCLVEDVSERGLRVRLRGPGAEAVRRSLSPNHSVLLDFSPFDPQRPYTARCTLLKSFQSQGRPYLILILDQVDAKLKDLIRGYIDRVTADSH